MSELWDKFIEFHNGEYNARDQFDKLCIELLEYHYPGKQIINANKIDRIDSFHDLLLVYLPKFFTDSLNVSRKGQIRKAFNKTIEIAQKNGLQIFKWVVCTSHTLSQSELQWWNQWKYKNQDQYNIDIELIDGQQIVELLKKYNIYEKWFSEKQKIPEKTKEQQTTSEILEIDFLSQSKMQQSEPEKIFAAEPIRKPSQQSTIEKEETTKPDQKLESEELKDKQAEAEQQQESKTSTGSQKIPTIQQSETEQSETISSQPREQEIKIEKYHKIAHNYKIILTKATELDQEIKEKFEKFRKISSFSTEKFKQKLKPDDFLETKILDLYLKAKNAELNRQYDQALFFYELLAKLQSKVKEQLPEKLKDIENSLRKIEKELEFEQKILLGDLMLAQDKKLQAFEAYEEALKLKENDREAKVKYNETLGDLLVESGLYSEAYKAYDEAYNNIKLTFEDNRKLLAKKRKLAKLLAIYTSLKSIPLIADFFLVQAKQLEENLPQKLVNRNEYLRLNRVASYTGVIIGIILAVFIIQKTIEKTDWRYVSAVPIKTKYTSIKAYDLYDIAMKKGDYFMEKFNNYGYLRVHLLDSALDAYQRAMVKYSYYDTAAVKKFQHVKAIRNAYIRLAQRRIKTDPEKYMVSMRGYSEGLKLIKYLYNPSDKSLGKYGYIDTNYNLIIPPVFDFDFNRRMRPGWENFHAGKAFVCLVVAPGDTAYFQINRQGQRVSKIYWINRKNRK